MLSVPELIRQKRGKGVLLEDDIRRLVLGYAAGDIPDYQMAAFCMAVCFAGLTRDETRAFTLAMVESGSRIDLCGMLGGVVADKHSTGGVGDKTSLIVAPLVASLGLPFGKMSGRGLAHAGGTIDKLESIPGFRTDLSIVEFVDQVREVSIAIVGQTEDLVPADKRIYGLRDVTGTVDELSLIASSIMSKKIAAGAGAIALDVKVGEGSFMPDIGSARALAETMRDIGNGQGLRTVCLLTDMSQPLGEAVGNALEVREAVAVLEGHGPEDVRELSLEIAVQLLLLADRAPDAAEARKQAESSLMEGRALAKYDQWIRWQGGNPDLAALPRAAIVETVKAGRSGVVQSLGALEVGRIALTLGAGRVSKDQPIEHAVGIVCRRKRGDDVLEGDILAEIHASDKRSAMTAKARLSAAFELGPTPANHIRTGVVLDVIV
jgi:pyrimidine-nucleoside phosphorylase